MFRKIFIIALNIIAGICLLYFGVLYLSGNTNVAYPDAMLPMEQWDRGGWALTIGMIPMIIINSLGFHFLFREGTPITKRLICFLPGIAEAVLVVSYLSLL